MATFLEKLGRGFTAASQTAQQTLIPALQAEQRRAENQKQQDLINDLRAAAEERAQGRFEQEQTKFEQEQELRSEPLLGRLSQLESAGIDVSQFFPAQSSQDVQTAEGLGVRAGTPINRIMELINIENAEREQAAQEASQKSRKTEAGISKTEAETARIQAQTGQIGAPSGVSGGVQSALARSFLGGRFERDPSGAVVTDPSTLKPIQAQVTSGAVDSLRTLLQRIDQPLFPEVEQPTDATQQAISELSSRIQAGEIKASDITQADLDRWKKQGINIVALKKALGLK